MPLSEFEITEDFPNGAKIIVNGEDVSKHVVAYQVSHDSPGELPRLAIVTLAKAGTIKGEGIVEVRVLDDRLLQMLDQVNPQELEEEALRRLEWGGSGVVAMALDILKERLSGDQPQGSAVGS
jgi:hypothetical protein